MTSQNELHVFDLIINWHEKWVGSGAVDKILIYKLKFQLFPKNWSQFSPSFTFFSFLDPLIN